MIQNPPTSAGDVRDAGSIPGLARSPGGGHGKPLQYSCLENPVDRGATPVFLPGESRGQRSLAGSSPLGRKESDTTEAYAFTCTHTHAHTRKGLSGDTKMAE